MWATWRLLTNITNISLAPKFPRSPSCHVPKRPLVSCLSLRVGLHFVEVTDTESRNSTVRSSGCSHRHNRWVCFCVSSASHLCSCVREQFMPPHRWAPTHWVVSLKFVYPFTSARRSALFLVLALLHAVRWTLFANLCGNIRFQVSRTKLLNGITGICHLFTKLPDCSPEWLWHFHSPNDGTGRSASSPTLSTVTLLVLAIFMVM